MTERGGAPGQRVVARAQAGAAGAGQAAAEAAGAAGQQVVGAAQQVGGVYRQAMGQGAAAGKAAAGKAVAGAQAARKQAVTSGKALVGQAAQGVQAATNPLASQATSMAAQLAQQAAQAQAQAGTSAAAALGGVGAMAEQLQMSAMGAAVGQLPAGQMAAAQQVLQGSPGLMPVAPFRAEGGGFSMDDAVAYMGEAATAADVLDPERLEADRALAQMYQPVQYSAGPGLLPEAAAFAKARAAQATCWGRLRGCFGTSSTDGRLIHLGSEEVILCMDLDEVQKQWLLSRWVPTLRRHSVKAAWSLRFYRSIGLIKTLCSVLVPVLLSMMQQGTDLELWGNIAIIISIVNTVAVALEDFFDFGVRSASRRTAANHMEKAFWEFHALAGQYRFFTSHRAAFRRFVEDAETITNKAEEIYVKTIMEDAGGGDGKKDDGNNDPVSAIGP